MRWGLKEAQSESAGRGTRTESEVWYTRDELARDSEVLHLPSGACFINPALMHGQFCVLPREVFLVPWDSACGGNWLRVEQSALIARKKSAKGVVGGEPSKARTVPREGSKREEQSIAKELRYCIRRALGEHSGRWDEVDVGAAGDDAPVGVQGQYALHIDSICRTAVYVTRSYGGVGGGSREASPYPE